MLKLQHPVVIALLIQIITLLLICFLIVSQSAIALSLFEWSLVQGLLAGLISYYTRMPAWWILIHLAFIPLAITTLALNISSTWFLVFFLCLLLIYGKTYKTQVPLYLSSKCANHALETLLPEQEQFSFVDLGSGCGGLVKNLASSRRNGIFHGIESAPLPFLISKLRSIFCASSYKVF